VSKHDLKPDGLILEMPYGSLLDTVRRRFELMGFPVSAPFAELLVFWGGVQHGYNAFQLNPVAFASAVTTPTLLLGGSQDYRVSPEVLEQLGNNLAGPKRIQIFDNRGHESLFEAEPQQYEQLVQEFFQDWNRSPTGLSAILGEARAFDERPSPYLDWP
jgi:alpha-beta hydrolase superfamily lysophospholipase